MFRFTIRDVLLLTVVVALVVGWCIDHFNQASLASKLANELVEEQSAKPITVSILTESIPMKRGEKWYVEVTKDESVIARPLKDGETLIISGP